MTRPRPVIAIDGPAGVGKSTTARALAQRLGYTLVDTGALYRGVALAARDRGVSWEDEAAVVAIGDEAELGFASQEDGTPRLLINGQDRADEGGVVLEGRDIGTVVFPDAEVKLFLTASAEERARRRVQDLQDRGTTADYDEILAKIRSRDEADSTRAIAPLRPAEDAVILDSTSLDLEAVVLHVLELVDSCN